MQTTFTITSEADLNSALQQIDIGGTSAGAPVYTFTFTANLTDTNALSSDLDAINIGSGSTLNIVGNNFALDGANTYRGFFVISGTVNISNLTIQNTTASGGAGGAGQSGGGGGLGAGGGLFVNTGASVSLTNVSFTGDAAVGGIGGQGAYTGSGGGGGGMGGKGGSSGAYFTDKHGFGGERGGSGGGGLGLGATGGAGAPPPPEPPFNQKPTQPVTVVGSPGDNGVGLGASSGGRGAGIGHYTGAAGGASAGGGGGGFSSLYVEVPTFAGYYNHYGYNASSGGGGGGIGGSAGSTGSGGNGGDFGGGGGFGGGKLGSGGAGGFGGGGGGGGGGSGLHAGKGGFGGGGGGLLGTVGSGDSPAAGGFGGGEGGLNGGGNVASYPAGGGGGGAGFGGAVFVRQGGTLTINDGAFSDGSVEGGAGGASVYNAYAPDTAPNTVYGGAGQAAGTAMFLQGTGSVTYEADTSETISDTIVDEKGWVVTTGYTPPTGYVPGSYTVDKTGSGTLTLSGSNAYSGGTTIEDGELDLTVLNAAGIGEINFGGDPATAPTTLQIQTAALDNTDTFDNTIGIFRVGQTIDLAGIGTATSAPVNSDQVTVEGGAATVTLQLDSSLTYGGFKVTSDLNGGTDLVLVPTITSVVGTPVSPADVELKGTAQAGDSLTFLDENGDTIGTGSVAPDGSFDVTMTTALTDGVHSVTATENDPSSGLTSPASQPFTVDVLPSPPVIITLVNAQPVVSGTTVELRGTAEANETVDLFLNGGTMPVGTGAADGSGDFDITTNVPLGDGAQVFTATETDAANLTSPSSGGFTVDVVPVAPSITTLVGQPVNNGKVELEGTGETENDTIDLYADGISTIIGTGQVLADGTFDITTTATFADGVHTFTATETAGANLTSAPSSPAFTVDIDPNAPALTTLVGQPVNGGTVELQGTGETQNDTIDLYADGKTGTIVGTGTVRADGTFDITTTATFADAVHGFTATETDAAGLTSLQSSPAFLVDVDPNPPAITTLGGQPVNGGKVELQGTGENGDIVDLYADGNTTSIVGTGTVAGGMFDITTTALFADGAHTFTATQTDGSGLTSAQSSPAFTVDVDPNAPAITMLVGQPINGGTVELQGSGETQGDIIDLYASGTTTIVGTGQVGAGGAFDITTTATFADGVHTFTATETDAAGLTSAASSPAFSVDVDPIAPSITAVVGQSVDGGKVELQGIGESGDTVALYADGNTNTIVGIGTVGAGGTFDITTAATFALGSHSFTATETDAANLTSTPSNSLAVEVAPGPMTHRVSVFEGASTGTLAAGDGNGVTVTALDGGTVGSSDAGTYGTLTLNANDTYSYTAGNTAAINAAPTGSHPVDTFTYTVSDGHGGTATDTLDFSIDRPPTSTTHNATVAEGASTGTVAAGDSDPDGDAITVTAVNGGTVGSPLAGTYGTLTLSANDTFTYVASNTAAINAVPSGTDPTDTFSYTVSDGNGGTATEMLAIAITRPPTIAGTQSNQLTTAEAPVKPFSSVTIGDPNAGATDTLTITLSSGDVRPGTLSGTGLTGSGSTYQLTGTAAAITAELDALSYTPVNGLPETSVVTTFDLSDQSSVYATATTNHTTTVVDTDLMNPPVPGINFPQVSPSNVDEWILTDGELSASAEPGSMTPGYNVIGTGDFTGNGLSDILWQNPSTGDTQEWLISNGGWASTVDLGAHPGNYQIAGIGDFFGNGIDDVLWTSTSSNGTVATDIWELSSSGNWMASVSPGSHPAGYNVVGVGDFTGNGTSDILWQNPATGDVDEWLIKNGQWAGSVDLGPHPGTGWSIAGIGDFTGNGSDDILWVNPGGGPNGGTAVDIWELGSNGRWVASDTPGLGVHPAGYQVAAVGNFTGNGVDGVLWYNPTSSDVDEWVLNNNGNGQWAESIDLGAHSGAFQIAGTGAFVNGNATSDILWHAAP